MPDEETAAPGWPPAALAQTPLCTAGLPAPWHLLAGPPPARFPGHADIAMQEFPYAG
ncbi:MAG TPA: hypothetical protein VGG25_17320 [Streptosporangiaceae bacterium]|jgi:hypothetical protein